MTPAAAAPSARRAPAAKKPARDYAWCADEVESLGNSTCYIDGRKGSGAAKADGKRTLVIFLHGVIGKHTDWSWTQERALLRQAKASGFEAIFPRAPDTGVAYAWPGGAEAQAKHEDELIAGWKRAQKQLEARGGGRYEKVFVMGFSSGAYYVSSLVWRGRLALAGSQPIKNVARRELAVNGYAVFAGGSTGHQRSSNVPKAPVYVGICGTDKQTASHSRGFAGELATRGFPVRAEEHKVGHMFSDPHVAHAIEFLRTASSAHAPEPAALDATPSATTMPEPTGVKEL